MVLFTGSTVEEAIQKGLNELNITRMKAHIKVISREKKGFLGLFGKKPAQVDIESISETTVVKANQQAIKGVPKEINEQNEPVKTVSEATVDLGHVVEAIKKIEEEGQGVSDEVKAEILKNDKEASTILEETGHIEILKDLQPEETQVNADEEQGSDLENLGLKVEPTYDTEKVVEKVTNYVQAIIDDMDVEGTISSTSNRRSINMQIDTNEPGRIIGYHGKVLKSLQLLAQNYRSQMTDPMSSSERKIIHRIISRMEGVTSYSEGDEPNRYVVVDTE